MQLQDDLAAQARRPRMRLHHLFVLTAALRLALSGLTLLSGATVVYNMRTVFRR